MNDNENGLVWIFSAYLFSFSLLAAGYVVATSLIDPGAVVSGIGETEVERIQNAMKRYKSLSSAGLIFTSLSWVVIVCQTFIFKVHGKIYFVVTLCWGFLYLALSPASAVLVVPVFVYLFFNREKILSPQNFEEPEISIAERMKIINDIHQAEKNRM